MHSCMHLCTQGTFLWTWELSRWVWIGADHPRLTMWGSWVLLGIFDCVCIFGKRDGLIMTSLLSSWLLALILKFGGYGSKTSPWINAIWENERKAVTLVFINMHWLLYGIYFIYVIVIGSIPIHSVLVFLFSFLFTFSLCTLQACQTETKPNGRDLSPALNFCFYLLFQEFAILPLAFRQLANCIATLLLTWQGSLIIKKCLTF